jgi:hypothetical protein
MMDKKLNELREARAKAIDELEGLNSCATYRDWLC